ncbi:MAG: signal peptidase II [Thermodesulfovibrionales bacterium]
MRRPALAFAIAASVVALDQATKYLADTLVSPSAPVEVLPFLALVNVKNTGAAFGMLSGLGNPFFIAVSAIAIVVIGAMLIRGRDGFLSLALILGGAVGNLVDRVFLGHVRDFVDVHAWGYHWPAFNVADSALTVGIAVLVAASLLKR